MRIRRVIYSVFILLLLLSASCSQEEPEAPPTPTPSPEQYLQSASEAMAGVTTVQFSLTREGEPLVLDASLGALFISATGEYQAPDSVHANVKADISENVIALDFLWLPEDVYMTNPLTGQYMKQPFEIPLDPSALFDPQVGLSRILVSKIEGPEFVGFEQIDGQETIHLRGKTDAETVTIILPIEIAGEFKLDIWLDALSHQVFRLQITEDNGDITAMDFFGYGEPVDIPLPE
jgi:lipoprotein LprG